jgi:hypothetical protein
MPVSPTLALIDQYQPKFESQWRRLAQQVDSRLSGAVSVNSNCTGEVNYRDQIKPIDVSSLGTPSQNRIAATAISEIETQKRANYPEKFQAVKHFDEFDEVWLAEQSKPTSQTFLEFKAGFNRKMDDLIIAAATGTAKTGNNGAVSTDLPTGQVISVDTGGTGSGMNLAKILDAKQLMEENEVFGQDIDGDEAYLVLNAKALRGLYDEAKITSSDYAGELQALYNGEIDQFLGFNFIRTERLAVATNVRTCFAFVKSGIALDIWQNPKFKLSERNDFNDAAQLRGTAAAGATRLEEVKVVEIPCDES